MSPPNDERRPGQGGGSSSRLAGRPQNSGGLRRDPLTTVYVIEGFTPSGERRRRAYLSRDKADQRAIAWRRRGWYVLPHLVCRPDRLGGAS
jgi:hypothetical protein